MAVNLTTDTITGASGKTETVIIGREEFSNGFGGTDLEISIAADNSAYLDRIATALETIATNSTEINNNIDRLRQLGDHPNGLGIRTVQPYGILGVAALYHLYINQGQILEDDEVSSSLQADSLAKYKQVIDQLLNNFDANEGGF